MANRSAAQRFPRTKHTFVPLRVQTPADQHRRSQAYKTSGTGMGPSNRTAHLLEAFTSGHEMLQCAQRNVPLIVKCWAAASGERYGRQWCKVAQRRSTRIHHRVAVNSMGTTGTTFIKKESSADQKAWWHREVREERHTPEIHHQLLQKDVYSDRMRFDCATPSVQSRCSRSANKTAKDENEPGLRPTSMKPW